MADNAVANHNAAANQAARRERRHAAGELPPARDAWRKAVTILGDPRLPDADDVRVKLASIDRQMS